ncbi:DUF4091 domain-containing protein [Paenibacillus hodogayensis]|uniref:DUF4091 domain-containing protein n=1 Tax=Paenibacillus hodogayensis TaxID=279208 RepID=A0ABV5W8W8_9BACL
MTAAHSSFTTRTISSLEKVFADEELQAAEFRRATALQKETFSYQVAYRSAKLAKKIQIRVESALASSIAVRTVGLVPAEMPVYHDHDEHVLRSTPGLYPDPLLPVTEAEGLTGLPHQWRSIWVTVDLSAGVPAGSYPITVVFTGQDGQELARETLELDVLAAALPEQKLIHTEWFHTDCLATYYGVDVFSERYWEIVDNYVKTAVAHGINMLLTPLFTPPLDTAIGGERPTVQLVDVEKAGDAYTFGFEKLKRWVEMCDRNGVRYFELSHLFTQWGAKHAPKIVAVEDGETKRIFGWDTDATGEGYKSFLEQFLPELVGFIRSNGLEERVYFHVSDEPHKDHIPWYESASRLLKRFVGDFPSIDALSDYDFYEKGLVPTPVPASNHIEPFLQNAVPGLWTYYCCSQYKQVANRFISMPSARNRVLGLQLYKFQIAGFLHWGYNFWYAQYSRFPIDPYRNTDANYAFPSGDPFVVYPGEDGTPVESLRLEVFREALQDLRALTLLESLIGRERTLELMEQGTDAPITFDVYPRDAAWLLACRERINEAIRSHTA